MRNRDTDLRRGALVMLVDAIRALLVDVVTVGNLVKKMLIALGGLILIVLQIYLLEAAVKACKW